MKTKVLLTLVLPLFFNPGCVSREVGRTPGSYITPARDGESGRLDPKDVAAQMSWRKVGEVDYDDFSIPLSSPDGRFLAVRAGAPPAWPAILARPDASGLPVVPFEILRLDADGVESILTIRGPWLLGRDADETGFLVEGYRPNGARRIGRVSWETGEVTWLIDDEFVNAFATIGGDGTLAWSRRSIDDRGLDLKVRRPDGSTWTVESRFDRSWVDPVIAPDGRTIFALRKGDGTVELGWSRLTEQTRFEEGMQTIPISIRTNDRLVHSMLAPQTGDEASPPGGPPRIVFLHPDLGRMIEWSPDRDLARPFSEGTMAVCMLDADRGIAMSKNGLFLTELTEVAGGVPASILLSSDVAIPRRSGIDADPILFLRPKSGRYEFFLAHLNDVE
ncbi:MAG: hypothetical protein CMM01_14100 [Rhodopirellula sp.]|nr:hypothetical protein [Rhodopirellula sp.]